MASEDLKVDLEQYKKATSHWFQLASERQFEAHRYQAKTLELEAKLRQTVATLETIHSFLTAAEPTPAEQQVITLVKRALDKIENWGEG